MEKQLKNEITELAKEYGYKMISCVLGKIDERKTVEILCFDSESDKYSETTSKYTKEEFEEELFTKVGDCEVYNYYVMIEGSNLIYRVKKWAKKDTSNQQKN